MDCLFVFKAHTMSKVSLFITLNFQNVQYIALDRLKSETTEQWGFRFNFLSCI